MYRLSFQPLGAINIGSHVFTVEEESRRGPKRELITDRYTNRTVDMRVNISDKQGDRRLAGTVQSSDGIEAFVRPVKGDFSQQLCESICKELEKHYAFDEFPLPKDTPFLGQVKFFKNYLVRETYELAGRNQNQGAESLGMCRATFQTYIRQSKNLTVPYRFFAVTLKLSNYNNMVLQLQHGLITHALNQARWKKRVAAKQLGLARSTLDYYIKEISDKYRALSPQNSPVLLTK